MADLIIHNSPTTGQGWPTYADRAEAARTTKITVGVVASAAIDVSEANVLRVYNDGDGAGAGTLHIITGLAAVGAPTIVNTYPLPVGQVAYICLDATNTHVRFIGTNAGMSVWYSQVG